MIWIMPIIIALITWFVPEKLRLVLFIINIFVPDTIPYIDEVIMFISVIRGISDKRVKFKKGVKGR